MSDKDWKRRGPGSPPACFGHPGQVLQHRNEDAATWWDRSGLGWSRGAGGTPAQSGAAHTPHPRTHSSEKSRPAARAGLEGKDLLTRRCYSLPKRVGAHPKQDGLEMDNLCVFRCDCKQWNKTRIQKEKVGIKNYLQSHSEAGCKEPENPQNKADIIDVKELRKADNELLEWIAHRNWAFELNFT